MARKTAAELGMKPEELFEVAISGEQCGKEYAELISKGTRAEHGGKFWGQGFAEPVPW
jgi:hypothetical protein